MTDPRPVVLYPAEVLRMRCADFGVVSAETRDLAAELRASLSATAGIGLAAPQIGVASRMVLVRADPKTRAGGGLVMIDPVIVGSSEEVTLMMEGCLSLPGQRLPVARPAKVIVEYMSETGRIRTVEFDGLAAKCAQHEIDHLDGVLILDRSVSGLSMTSSPTTAETAAATAAHLSRSK